MSSPGCYVRYRATKPQEKESFLPPPTFIEPQEILGRQEQNHTYASNTRRPQRAAPPSQVGQAANALRSEAGTQAGRNAGRQAGGLNDYWSPGQSTLALPLTPSSISIFDDSSSGGVGARGRGSGDGGLLFAEGGHLQLRWSRQGGRRHDTVVGLFGLIRQVRSPFPKHKGPLNPLLKYSCRRRARFSEDRGWGARRGEGLICPGGRAKRASFPVLNKTTPPATTPPNILS